jgi:hypothetical protein
LHERGYWVVPCDGKRARIKKWNERRVTLEELRAELNHGAKRNIALELSHSDLVDVECDSDEAANNLQALFGGQIPTTPSWRSKRGVHRLFRRPDGLPEKAKIELDGVEFRIGNGKGALSIVPPSVHPEGPVYRWLPGLSLYEVEPAELPAEIIARLRAPAPATKASLQPFNGEIAEGKRNDTLFRKACALWDLVPPDMLVTVLLDLNRQLCKPPLPEEEVRGIATSVAKGKPEGSSPPLPGDEFVERLLAETTLWHDENSEPYLTLTQDDHEENWAIGKRSRPFRRWLCKKFYDTTGEVLSDSGLSEIAGLLEGKAVYDAPEYQICRRVGEQDGRYYLDLCNKKWQAVEIGPDGWQLIDEPPVKFRRAKAMQALPLPARSEDSLGKLLLPFLNIRQENWPLVAAALTFYFRPRGPYPVLKLHGEQGSAKTTTARVLRAILDPNTAPVRAEPREARDLMIAANNGWVICLDNLSSIATWLSDALCRLATGGGFSTRTLYTDDDETIFDAMRPVILTSIEEIGARSDLMERSVIIELPTIAEDGRRAEKAFWAEFQEKQPYILGALLDVFCAGLKRLPEIEAKPAPELSRMADFHQWGEAVEEAFGLEPGAFAEAYTANREAATHIVLESSPVVAALLKYLEYKKRKDIEETATELLDNLKSQAGTDPNRQPGWPKTSRVLSQILKRVAPNLRNIGVIATQDTRGGGQDKKKVWRIFVKREK